MRIGIDLGGTKIEALALGDDGEQLARKRVPTPKDSYEAIVKAIADLVFEVERECGQKGSVGVGIPGASSPATGLVKNANTIRLIRKPLAKDLQEHLEREVRLANDANCFTLSEATDGAASASALGTPPKIVFGVIIGTGTGGGIVVAGQLLEGVDRITGEWGHNPLPWAGQSETPGPKCWCGLRGCVETFLSGPALEREHREQSGQDRSSRQIAKAALAGDKEAEQTLQTYSSRLARALASVINLLNPDVIVLGGGLSNIDSLLHTVPKLWGKHVFSDVVSTRLVRAAHGDSSGVRGAAWLWPA